MKRIKMNAGSNEFFGMRLCKMKILFRIMAVTIMISKLSRGGNQLLCGKYFTMNWYRGIVMSFSSRTGE
jgi:hypothetical protein